MIRPTPNEGFNYIWGVFTRFCALFDFFNGKTLTASRCIDYQSEAVNENSLIHQWNVFKDTRQFLLVQVFQVGNDLLSCCLYPTPIFHSINQWLINGFNDGSLETLNDNQHLLCCLGMHAQVIRSTVCTTNAFNPSVGVANLGIPAVLKHNGPFHWACAV